MTQAETIQDGDVKMVPFNQVDFDAENNARRELKDIDELAESIKFTGHLLEPIGVSNGGTGDKPYKAEYGFRRGAALKKLRWGDKLIPVVMVSKEKATEANLIENVCRKDLPTIDVAQRLRDMEAGEAPGAFGRKYTKAELAKIVNRSVAHVGNLIRAVNNCGKAAKDAWRKYEAPTTVVFYWASLKDEAEQDKAVAKFIAEQERIKERTKALSGKEGGDGESEGGGRRSRSDEEEDDGPKPLVKGKKATELENLKNIIEWKLATGQIKGVGDTAAAEAEVRVLRYMLGEIARYPSISAAEKKEYKKFCDEQNAPQETEEEEGEE